MTYTRALAIAATRAMTLQTDQYMIQTEAGDYAVITDHDMTVRLAGERILSVHRPDGSERHV